MRIEGQYKIKRIQGLVTPEIVDIVENNDNYGYSSGFGDDRFGVWHFGEMMLFQFTTENKFDIGFELEMDDSRVNKILEEIKAII